MRKALLWREHEEGTTRDKRGERCDWTADMRKVRPEENEEEGATYINSREGAILEII